jgi:hypothetical protein
MLGDLGGLVVPKIRSGHLIDGGGAAGKKIPAGNEKRIPGGDGDPFSL